MRQSYMLLSKIVYEFWTSMWRVLSWFEKNNFVMQKEKLYYAKAGPGKHTKKTKMSDARKHLTASF